MPQKVFFHEIHYLGRTLAKFNELKRNKRFDNFIMLVWVQGSLFHIAAGSHPVQEACGSQDSLYRGQIQKLLQCCQELYQKIPLDITIQKKYSLTCLMHHFVVIEEKVKGKIFGSRYRGQTGKNAPILLAMVSNVYQVNTIKSQNSLPCVRCFVTMVMQQRWVSQWTLTFSLHNHVTVICYMQLTILNLNCIYKTSILRPLPAKLEHFYLFDQGCRAKNLTFDLFFNNYERVRQRQVKLYFLNRYNKRNLWFQQY